MRRNFREKITVNFFVAVVCLIVSRSMAVEYSGGSGEPNDPYQIATAADLIALGEAPNEYDKHFILTADIDLDPNLPGRKVFEKAVIAPDTNDVKFAFQGTEFDGVFDGNGHVISNLHIQSSGYLGLFGRLDYTAKIFNLGLEAVNISGTGSYIGSLTGSNSGDVINCYSTGTVSGKEDVGGLVGSNGGDIDMCCSTANVSGNGSVGGLVGANGSRGGSISLSFSTGTVTGDGSVGGLVGYNSGPMTNCYSNNTVNGQSTVGGLVGINTGLVTNCYSNSTVNGQSTIGGLAGLNDSDGKIRNCLSTGRVSGINSIGGLIGRREGIVASSLWDIEASGQTGSNGGVGLTTAEMMDPYMLGLNGFANDPNWILNPGLDYPRLAWEGTQGQIIPEPEVDWLEGDGTAEDPYLLFTAEQMILLGKAGILWDKSFVLGADIDLDPNKPDGKVFRQALIHEFTGIFDGNDHTISNIVISGGSHLGFFGLLENGAEVKNLGIENANILGTDYLGSLAAINDGNITMCHSTGEVIGKENIDEPIGQYDELPRSEYIGGLIGYNSGNITMCYSTGSVTGGRLVGGLVGINACYNVTRGITASYSTAMVNGDVIVGGFAGGNGSSWGSSITTCYSTGTVSGDRYVGGFVGINNYGGDGGNITNCYSTGLVTGNEDVGGFAGIDWGIITSCFWDVETSSQATSDIGVGKTTAEMQDPNTFIAEGWGFVSLPDVPHGTWIEPDSGGYPILWWQSPSGFELPVFAGGKGEPNDPYLISTTEQLNAIGNNPKLMDSHFKLINDLDATALNFYPIGSPDYPYRGVFDGNGHTISHLTIEGVIYLGMFGVIADGAEVKDLEIVDVNVTGSDSTVGGLAGVNLGSTVTNCFITGIVTGGGWYVGGLVGENINSSIIGCYSVGTIDGDSAVGGLVGYNNNGSISESYSTGSVTGGEWHIGGLVGTNSGIINMSYSTGEVRGEGYHVGGLVGRNAEGISGTITNCYSTSMVTGNNGVGGLVGRNAYPWEDGTITNCFSTGVVTGREHVGGLVGSSDVDITNCFSTGAVTGISSVGGLVGDSSSNIITSYSKSTVTGTTSVGGLAGFNWSNITNSYSTGMVIGDEKVGGLVGRNWGNIHTSYSIGTVIGNEDVGGLVGDKQPWGNATSSFWDKETSRKSGSDGGTGKTTTQMQTASTFLNAGWDFVDETANGTEDIWWIDEGVDYPHLWWEAE